MLLSIISWDQTKVKVFLNIKGFNIILNRLLILPAVKTDCKSAISSQILMFLLAGDRFGSSTADMLIGVQYN